MKYQNLNVLSQKKDYMSDDCIQEVANMINNCGGNRSQRKRLERALNKVENIYSQAQKRVDRSAFRLYMDELDKNYVHFFACLGLCMIEQYHWNEAAENEHGQISSLIERVDKTIRKYAEMEYTTEDIVKELEDKTGILLVPDTH
jgi:hypothetical protein